MTKNGDIKKNYKKIIGIGVSILAIIIVFCMGFIWSKYISSAQGESTGTVAKWCFKLTNGISEYANITEFAVTRTDDSNVDRSTIAPGTRGKVEIDVDARGTETSLTYDIDVAFSNKPHNLKLYSDEAMTDEIILDANNGLTMSNVLTLDDAQYIYPNTIYWKWPIETGNTPAEIEANNAIDLSDIDKNMTMSIIATGTQVDNLSLDESAAASTTINGTTTKYLSVKEAIQAAGNNSGAIVTVLRDRVEESITIGSSQNFILNLNGKTVTLGGNDSATTNYGIKNNGNLTIRGSGVLTCETKTVTIYNYGTFIKEGDSSIDNIKASGAIRTLYNSGTATLRAGRITRSKPSEENGTSYYAILNTNSGILNIEGATIDATTPNSGYHVAIANNNQAATTTINSGTIIGDSDSIFQSNGTLTINNGAIKSDHARAISIQQGTVTINNGVLSSYYTDVIRFAATSNGAVLNIIGGTIHGYYLATGLRMTEGSNSTLNMSGGEIISERESAIINSSTGNITLTGGSITSKENKTIYIGNTSNTVIDGATITALAENGDEDARAIVIGDGGINTTGNLTIKGQSIISVNENVCECAIKNFSNGVVTIGTSGDSSIEYPLIEGGIYSQQLGSTSACVNFYSGKITKASKYGIESNSNVNITGGKISINSNGACVKSTQVVDSNNNVVINNNTIAMSGGILENTNTNEEASGIKSLSGGNVNISGGSIDVNGGNGVYCNGEISIVGNTQINSVKKVAIETETGIISVSATATSNRYSDTVGPIINSEENIGIKVVGAGTLTLGVAESNISVSVTIPSITGKTYGTSVDNSATFNFNDGIIRGKDDAITGKYPTTPAGYTTTSGTDSQGYKTLKIRQNI